MDHADGVGDGFNGKKMRRKYAENLYQKIEFLNSRSS